MALCATFLSGCDSETTNQLLITESVGGFDEIVIVADKRNLETYLKEPLVKTFKTGYEVLPQYEATFDARIIAYENFDNIFKKFRTVIFVGDLSDNTTVTEFIIRQLKEDNTAKALNNKDFYYASVRDVWARPQRVIFIFAPTKELLLERISSDMERVIELAQQSETEKYRNNAYLPGLNNPIIKKLKEEADIELKVPIDYLHATGNANFMWLRNIKTEYDKSILLSWHPWEHDEFPDPIAWRDTLGKRYVSSEAENSYMISDTILPFLQKEISLNGYRALETRGLWSMENDFMGGPFINYMILDEKKKRIIMMDGFVFAPGENNKPQLRLLEAILREFGKAG